MVLVWREILVERSEDDAVDDESNEVRSLQ